MKVADLSELCVLTFDIPIMAKFTDLANTRTVFLLSFFGKENSRF